MSAHSSSDNDSDNINFKIIEHLKEKGLHFIDDKKSHSNDEDNLYFDDEKNIEYIEYTEDYFKAISDYDLAQYPNLKLEVSCVTKNYNRLIEFIAIFRDSNLYNQTGSLFLDITNNRGKAAQILTSEIINLSDLIRFSKSLNTIDLSHFKLSPNEIEIFFQAVNHSNINELIFEVGFPWRYSTKIFAKIAENKKLRNLQMYNIDGNFTREISELFYGLRLNNSPIEQISTSFRLINQNFEALILYLEADNNLTNIDFRIDFKDIDFKLCDRFWLVINQKNLMDMLNLENLTVRKIKNLNLDNITWLTVGENDESVMISIIEKIKLKDGLLDYVRLDYNTANHIIYELIKIDKVIKLFVPLKIDAIDIDQFYKLLPDLEKLENLHVYGPFDTAFRYDFSNIFSADIWNYLKYNSSLFNTNIEFDSDDSKQLIGDMIDRNWENHKINSLTLIDILKQYSKK